MSAAHAAQARRRLTENAYNAVEADGDVAHVYLAVLAGLRGHLSAADAELADRFADATAAHFAETNGPDHG